MVFILFSRRKEQLFSRYLLSNQFPKSIQTSFYHILTYAVGNADIAGTAEIVAGDEEKILRFRFLTESAGVPAGSFYKEIEGALRFNAFIAERNE